ncbi:MAG: tRNA dihydrouridine synthase DusB [Candidatus Hydrogenedentes bacterium]|nr:tRNA dihydrouridine synthase DusB [Candidatus Hydrogenedentota bacterium]
MKIGPIEIDKPLCLAPMEDVSNLPFRVMCKEQGADIVYTEFTNCEALIRNVKGAMRKIQVCDAERPVAIQLYGSGEESMEQATEIAEMAGADFIDINCGCWVKKVAHRGDGAGLLRDLNKFKAVVQSVQRGTKLPVTVKTRLGWDENSYVILDVAPMLEDLGVQALTVHCRTRKQGYTGQADWNWLARIKEASKIPLIANGDINTPEDVKACFDLGCDGVMIGRGAIHSPWIFRYAKHYLKTGEILPEPAFQERVEMCIRHLKDSVAHRGESRGVKAFRRHYQGYLSGLRDIKKLRNDLMTLEEVAPIIDRLYRFLDDFERGEAA